VCEICEKNKTRRKVNLEKWKENNARNWEREGRKGKGKGYRKRK
jgi:hypothetical protein